MTKSQYKYPFKHTYCIQHCGTVSVGKVASRIPKSSIPLISPVSVGMDEDLALLSRKTSQLVVFSESTLIFLFMNCWYYVADIFMKM